MQYKKYEIIKSEYIIHRPWLTARKDTLRMRDGRINPEYYVLEYPDWVNIIAITDDEKFVMEKQYRHGLQWEGFEIPAGVIEKGETPLEAAKRELWEETGFGGGEWTEHMIISPNSSTSNNLVHCFIAKGVTKLSDEQHLDSTEEISVHLLDKREVLTLMNEGKIIQALMLAPLWKYFAIHPIKPHIQ